MTRKKKSTARLIAVDVFAKVHLIEETFDSEHVLFAKKRLAVRDAEIVRRLRVIHGDAIDNGEDEAAFALLLLIDEIEGAKHPSAEVELIDIRLILESLYDAEASGDADTMLKYVKESIANTEEILAMLAPVGEGAKQ